MSRRDIMTVLALTVLAVIFITVPPLDATPVRTVLGLALVLFLPGYALTAALFPSESRLTGIERIAFSFGLSIAVTPLIGLALNYTPWGIDKAPVLLAVSILTVVCSLVALARSVPEESKPKKKNDTEAETRTGTLDKALTIILALSIIASVAVLVYVIITPKQGERFTEFYILGPGGKADGYPTDLTVGANGTVIIGVVNHEYAPVEYKLQVVLDGSELTRKDILLEHNQTYLQNYSFTPRQNGTQKLQFLLYKNGIQEPYRTLHLWIKAYNRTR